MPYQIDRCICEWRQIVQFMLNNSAFLPRENPGSGILSELPGNWTLTLKFLLFQVENLSFWALLSPIFFFNNRIVW